MCNDSDDDEDEVDNGRMDERMRAWMMEHCDFGLSGGDDRQTRSSKA